MQLQHAQDLVRQWNEHAPAPDPDTLVQQQQRDAQDFVSFLRDVIPDPERSALIESPPEELAEQQIGALLWCIAGTSLYGVSVIRTDEGHRAYVADKRELAGVSLAITERYRIESGARIRYRSWTFTPQGGRIMVLTGRSTSEAEADADEVELLGRAVSHAIGWPIS